MTKVTLDLQKLPCARYFRANRHISHALRSESFAPLSPEFRHALRGEWQAEGLIRQICHPEPFDYTQDKLREGSRGEILRCTQNDTGGWSHRKVYESSVFRFSLLDQISDALPRKSQKRLPSTNPEIPHAVRGELRDPLAVF